MTAKKVTSYEGGYSGSAIEPKNPVKHQNKVESIAGRSFLFFFLNKSLDLTFLFSIRRPQYCISHTKSLIFNGLL